MAYNPGVQDIRGQLMAQGMNRAFDSLADGILAAKKKHEEDKTMLAKARSTESFIKAHPDLFGGKDVVDQMTSTDPKESPFEKYARLSQVVQDAIIKEKIETDQQQAQAAKAQQAFEAFRLSELQRKAREEQEVNRRLDAYLAQQMAQQGTGGIPSVAGTSPLRNPPAPLPPNNPYLAEAAMQRQAYGRPASPESNVGALARAEVANIQSKSREEVAAAKAEAERVKQEAKGAAPTFHTDPESGVRFAVLNGQIVPVREPIPRHPLVAAIEADQKAGILTPEEAAEYKRKIYEKGGEFSPNSGMLFMEEFRRMREEAARGSSGDKPTSSKKSDYATPDEVVAAVREGKLSADEAKAIAKKKGWQ